MTSEQHSATSHHTKASAEQKPADRNAADKLKDEEIKLGTPETKSEDKSRESAPALETPESPASLPEQTHREEREEQETPETKSPTLAERVDERRAHQGRDEHKVAKAAADLNVIVEAGNARVENLGRAMSKRESQVAPVLVPAETVLTRAQAEVIELQQHVAQSPVNAHAPVWTPREPNTTGGYR